MPRAVMRFARAASPSSSAMFDALVVPSRAMEQALLDYGVQCPMHIIPTGMEMERFAGGDGQRLRAQLGIGPGQPVLVHVGRIAHEKNIEFCSACSPRSCAASPAPCSWSRAKGRRWPRARRTSARSDSRSTCASSGICRASASCSTATAPATCSCSPRRPRRGLVPARIHGTRHPGGVDGAHGHGRHRQSAARRAVAPDDEGEFANIVVRLLDDAPRRAAMSAEARVYAATWSAAAMADRLAGLYSAVVGQASRNSPVSQPV